MLRSHWCRLAGVAALSLAAASWTTPLHAGVSPDGWIQNDLWASIYFDTVCGNGNDTCEGCGAAGGDFNSPGHVDTDWGGGYDLFNENPQVGDDLAGLVTFVDPMGADVGPGAFRAGSVFIRADETGRLGDVVDHNGILADLGFGNDNVYAVSATYIENTSASTKRVKICTASDDSVLVIVDDIIAHARSQCRGTAGGCAESSYVDLAPGVHKIITVNHEGGGGFGFRLRLEDTDGPINEDNAGDAGIAFLGAEGGDTGQAGGATLVDVSEKDAPNGNIRAKNFNFFGPLLNPFGASGGGAVNLAGNWLAPHSLANEDPAVTDDWGDTDFGGEALAGGFAFGNLLPSPIWLNLDALIANFGSLDGQIDLNADVFNFQALVDAVNSNVVAGNPNPDVSNLPGDNVAMAWTTYVRNNTDEPLQVGLCTASDDSVKAFVNQQLVTNVSQPRGVAGGCAEINPAVLEPGINKIAGIVAEGGGGWGLRLGIVLPNGELFSDAFYEDGDEDGILDGAPIQIEGSKFNRPELVTPDTFALNERSQEVAALGCPNDTATVTLTGNGSDNGETVSVTETFSGFSVFDLPDLDVSNVSDGGEFVTTNAPDTWTNVSTTGGDIWADCDSFQYDYTMVEGDFDYSVELVAYNHDSGAGRWGKFGPMIRFDLGNDALFHQAAAHGPDLQDGARANRRNTLGAGDDGCDDMTEVGSGLGAQPRFLRVEREGTTTRVWMSNNEAVLDDPADDASWSLVDEVDWAGEIPASVFVGFANSEHNSNGAIPQTVVYRILSGPDPDQFGVVGTDNGGASETTFTGAIPVDKRVVWENVGAATANEGLSYDLSFAGRAMISGDATLAGDVAGRLRPQTAIPYAPQTGPVGPFENSHVTGNPPTEGFTTEDGPASLTLSGSGADIWDGGDHMRFAYSEVTGDFDARVRVTDAVNPPNARWGRYGIMARYGCWFDSKYSSAIQPYRGEVLTDDNPDNDTANDTARHQSRRDHRNGGGTTRDQQVLPALADAEIPAYPSPETPQWFRLVRRGKIFYSFFAADEGGAPGQWHLAGADTHRDPPESLLLGVVSSSHGSAGANELQVSYDNWSVGVPEPIDKSGSPIEDQRQTIDYEDGDIGTDLIGDAVQMTGDPPMPDPNQWAPSVVALPSGNQVARIISTTRGGDANNLLYALPDANLADTGFIAEVDIYESKPGTEGDVNPADGGAVVFYEGIVENAADVLGGAGGASGWDFSGPNAIPSQRRRSFAVEFDPWDNGHGNNDPPGQGANAGDDGLYHIGVDFNQEIQSAQNNAELGLVPQMPSIFNQSADVDGDALHLEIQYLPVDDTLSQIKVYASVAGDGDGDGGGAGAFPRTKVLDILGPRLVGDITAGASGGTGGATVNYDIDNLSIAPTCVENTDEIVLSGPATADVGSSADLDVEVSGVDGDATVEASSSDEAVATVSAASEDGVTVDCVGAGTATITATLADGTCDDDASASLEIECVSAGVALVPGDTNADGILDISDGIRLLNILFIDNTIPSVCAGQAFNEGGNLSIQDFNGDGGVDISDGSAIFDFLFLGGPPHALGEGCTLIEDCEAEATCELP